MASTCFVIDEWLLYDLGGDNGLERQAEAFALLQKLKAACDKIAVLYGSPWVAKAYQLMSNADVRVRTVSRYLHGVILADPAKCRFIHELDLVALPDELLAAVPDGDRYLFRLHCSVAAARLVTTDETLCRVESARFGLQVVVQLRRAFLAEYL